MNRVLAIISLIALGAAGFLFFTSRNEAGRFAAERAALEAKVAEADARASAQSQELERVTKELEQAKTGAAEVHKLRGEVTQLRKALETAEKAKAQPGRGRGQVAQPAIPETAPTAAPVAPSIENLPELVQQVGPLRNKAFSGTLTKEEREYLDALKPELEKLEHSPKQFAEFQAGMIQAATGINDPAKLEQIRGAIEKVYDRAVSQGLDLPSGKPDDPAWTQQREQLDRRGTQAVQGMMSESERAAFDRVFIGVMGVDFGTPRKP